MCRSAEWTQEAPGGHNKVPPAGGSHHTSSFSPSFGGWRVPPRSPRAVLSPAACGDGSIEAPSLPSHCPSPASVVTGLLLVHLCLHVIFSDKNSHIAQEPILMTCLNSVTCSVPQGHIYTHRDQGEDSIMPGGSMQPIALGLGERFMK